MFRLYFRENKGWGGERERRDYNKIPPDRAIIISMVSSTEETLVRKSIVKASRCFEQSPQY